MPLLLVYLLPFNYVWLNILLGLVFAAFSLTDFFDGYLARKYRQETALGTILDPLADKFLTFSTLIALVVAHKIFFLWVVILIGREFFMMGLRQVALENSFSIKVSILGKIKTTLLMSCLTLIIVNPYQAAGIRFHGVGLWNLIEHILLLSTIALSVFSAYRYYQVFMTQFKMD